MNEKMTLGGWIESLEKAAAAAAAAAKAASTELYTLEEGDIFRLAPPSKEEVYHVFDPWEYDGLREDMWYRFIAGPDDVGCYSFAALDDHWDYHEQPGDLLVQKPVGKRINMLWIPRLGTDGRQTIVWVTTPN
jgi:hypothetical protein|tara:strand:+ start:231 stop:629 length:399 start_codon:yes stop_codon:yes gene_type:complete